jgi:DNA repair protein RecO (recombination protein O)
MIVETEAIILQARKFSDTSKIVQLFSKEFGKISVIAKGAYSLKSKFGGCLEPLSFVHITFYQKAGSNLHLLKTAEMIKIQNQIKKNYEALVVGLIIAEFISATQNENFECKELFNYSINFLENLNQHTELAFN